MKRKLLNLLTLVSFMLVLGGSSAWAYDVSTLTLPESTLDLAEPTMVTTEGNWTGTYSNFYSIENGYLIVNALIVRDNSTNQKWVSNNSSGSAGRTWEATDIFKGNAWYGATKGITIQTEKTLLFSVTNCTEIKSLVSGGGSARSAVMDIYEIANGSITNTTAVKSVVSEKGTNYVVITTGETLEPTKEYLVVFSGTATSNSTVAEVGFKIDYTNNETLTSASIGNNAITFDENFSYTDNTEYSSVPTVSVTTSVRTYEVTPVKDGNNYIATFTVGTQKYTITFTNIQIREATATWPFDLGTEGQVATFSNNDFFNSSFVTTGSNFTKYSQKTLTGADADGSTVYETAIESAGKNASPADGRDNINFMFNLKKGLKFTPTSISYRATRYSTGGGKIDTYWQNGDGTTVKLDAGKTPERDNGADGTGRKYTDYSYTMEDAPASEGSCGISLFVYNLDPGKSYGFCDITIEGIISGEAEKEVLYTITTSVTPEGAGSVQQSPAGTSLPENTAVTFTAKANAGYKFMNKWTVNGEEKTGETYSIDALNASVDITAQFEKLPVLTFAKPEDVVCINRAFPADVNTLENGATYTLPVNYMYYKEGYTMTGWTDGNANYNCGDEYIVNGDATLTPIFTENNVSIATRKNAATIKFDFDQSTNGGRIVNIENNEDIFITTAEVDGQTIDVTLAINCLKNAGTAGVTGKVNNTSGNRAQVNPGSVFTIPAAKGSVITLTSDNIAFSSTTFNGEAGEYGKTTATYTATENGDVRIVAQETGMYYKSITVTYPVPDYTLTTADADFYSLYLDYPATIPAGIEAYTGKLNAEETQLTLTKIEDGIIPAETGVLVKSPETTGEFQFAHAAEAGTATSDIMGVLTDTPVADLGTEGKVVLTLGLLNGEAGFRKPAGTVIKANRVYLTVNTPATSEAKGVRIVIGGDTTGISEINAAETEADAPTYNMAGQRVAAGTKGLLIKNGKKFIAK